MELTDKKRIRNRNIGLPKYSFGSILSSGLNAVTGLVDSFKSPVKHDQIVAEAPTAMNSVMGIPYQYKYGISSEQEKGYNSEINSNILKNTTNFASLGSSIGGYIGDSGEFGKSDKDKKIPERQFSLNNALQQLYNSTHDRSLSTYKKGKLPKCSLGSGAFGTIFGGAAGAILGGLAASSASDKLSKEIAAADRIIDSENMYNRNAALNLGIQDRFLKNHGDTRSLQLYKDGKLPSYSRGVATSEGYQHKKQGSWLSPNETIIDPNKGTAFTIPVKNGNRPNKKDNIPGEDVSDKIVLTSEGTDIWNATGSLDNAIAYDEANRQMKKDNKGLIKAADGFGYHTPANIAGLGLSLAQYFNTKGQPIQKPNTYVRNQGLNPGLRELGGLRVSSYPILPELYNQYAKSMYAISNSGGLSGGQRTLARLSALNNLQNNYAKLQQSNQMQNNQYRAAYADSLLKYGAQDAQDRMNSIRYDLDQYYKSHAAKRYMEDQYLSGAMNFLQKEPADQFKWDTYNDMLDLYQQKLKNEETETVANIYNMAYEKELAKQQAQKNKVFINPFAFASPGMLMPNPIMSR